MKIWIEDRRVDKVSTEAATLALEEALRGCGAVLCAAGQGGGVLHCVIGEAGDSLVRELLAGGGITPRDAGEGILLASLPGQDALVVSGTDARGLIYALYELEARLLADDLAALRGLSLIEYPENRVRGMDRYLMNHLDNEWFLSEAFWDYYLERLARCRFNRFTLITGFDTAFLTPPYPFFVVTPGYEAVSVEGLGAGERERNLQALCYIAEGCKRRGLEFCFGTWQQSPWTASQTSRLSGTPDTPAEYAAYCARGLAALLLACPGIGITQLRVNMESGMSGLAADGKTNANESFWRGMLDAVASLGRAVKVEIRAKGATDDLIAYGQSAGLDVSIATKYWCEHAALPYHIPRLRGEELCRIADMNSARRYSYSDMLRRPRGYDVVFRLWSYGSINLFLWGDADYCARFSKSMALGGGAGFTVNAPLSLMGGMEDVAAAEPWRARVDDNSRWEDERYWAFYQAFGLCGYHSGSGPAAFRREFSRRFGEYGEAMRRAYEAASRILPLLTTVHFPVHPSLHNWPELFAGAGLFAENNGEPLFDGIDYAHALPSDEQLFYSVADYVRDSRSGSLAGRYTPPEYQSWLYGLSREVKACVAALPKGSGNREAEIEMAVADFTMLAELGEYHAWKISAAYFLETFRQGGDARPLAEAHGAMVKARAAWERLSGLGEAHYAADLEFNAGTGTRRHGNWSDRLREEIDPDVARLEALMKERGLIPGSDTGSGGLLPFGKGSVTFTDDTPECREPGEDLPLSLTVEGGGDAPLAVTLYYRHANHMEGEYRSLAMTRTEPGAYAATIPGEYITGEFDLLLYFTAVGGGATYLHPGVGHPTAAFPYRVVRTERKD